MLHAQDTSSILGSPTPAPLELPSAQETPVGAQPPKDEQTEPARVFKRVSGFAFSSSSLDEPRPVNDFISANLVGRANSFFNNEGNRSIQYLSFEYSRPIEDSSQTKHLFRNIEMVKYDFRTKRQTLITCEDETDSPTIDGFSFYKLGQTLPSISYIESLIKMTNNDLWTTPGLELEYTELLAIMDAMIKRLNKETVQISCLSLEP